MLTKSRSKTSQGPIKDYYAPNKEKCHLIKNIIYYDINADNFFYH